MQSPSKKMNAKWIVGLMMQSPSKKMNARCILMMQSPSEKAKAKSIVKLEIREVIGSKSEKLQGGTANLIQEMRETNLVLRKCKLWGQANSLSEESGD